jgi:pimeloyl-ACP methyl ester carboxylesterase
MKCLQRSDCRARACAVALTVLSFYFVSSSRADELDYFDVSLQPSGVSPAAWAGIGMGDLANSGTTEIVGVENTTGDLWVWAADQPAGYRVLARSSAFGSGSRWAGLDVGDVSGDGRAEVVSVRNFDGRFFFHYVDKNSGTLAYTIRYLSDQLGLDGAAALWTDLALGDVDGDGVAEIIASRELGGEIIVFDVDASYHLIERARLSVLDAHTRWAAVTAGDLDGDGIDEIAAARNLDGDLFVFEFTGNALREVARHSAPGDGTAWIGLAAGDFDADGIDEIAGARNSDGAILIYAYDPSIPTGLRFSGRQYSGTSPRRWTALAAGDSEYLACDLHDELIGAPSAVGGLLSLSRTASRSVTHAFTRIAANGDALAGSTVASIEDFAISNSGAVAFVSRLVSGTYSIHLREPGGALTMLLATPTAAPFTLIDIDTVAVDSAGDIAFHATAQSGVKGIYAIRRGGSIAPIVTNADVQSVIPQISMNDRGEIACLVRPQSVTLDLLRVDPTGAISVVAGVNDAFPGSFTDIRAGNIAANGDVIFAAIKDAGSAGEIRGIFVGNGVAAPRLVTLLSGGPSSGPAYYPPISRPSLSDDGTVVFSAALDTEGARSAVFRIAGTALELVTHGGRSYDDFGGLNAAHGASNGHLLFSNFDVRCGRAGLYTGGTFARGRVIGVGDLLDGVEVGGGGDQIYEFASTRITAEGRFAFDATLLGGTVGIWRADPLPSDRSIGGRITDVLGRPIAQALVSTGEGQQSLTNSNGEYTLTGLRPGLYYVTPSKADHSFVPSSRRVATGSASAIAAQDFRGYDRPPIVLVHGWRGGATTFGAVPVALANAGYHVEKAILVSTESSTPTVEENAKILQQTIDRARDATGQPRVIVVAHSMGGLVSRAYIENPERYRQDVDQLFTFGTPHEGTPLAAAGTILGLVLTGPGGIFFNPFGCSFSQPAVCQMTTDGARLLNGVYSSRAPGVDYHVIGGDAPHTVVHEWCEDVWVGLRCTWFLKCRSVYKKVCFFRVDWPTFDWRSALGHTLGWAISGDDDAFVRTSSSVGVDGPYVDRWRTDEVHTSGLGPRSYFEWQSGQFGGAAISRSYWECLKRVLIDSPTRKGTCGARQLAPPTGGAFAEDEPALSELANIGSGRLAAEQSEMLEIGVEGGRAVFATTWDGDVLNVTLVDPSGQIVDLAWAEENPSLVNRITLESATAYAFPEALPGIWTVILEADASAPPEGVEYASFLSFSSPRSLEVEPDADGYRPGETASLTAWLSETPETANVTAKVFYPSGIETAADVSASGDGRYEISWLVLDDPGEAVIEVDARGTWEGDLPLARTVRASLSILSNRVRLAGPWDDALVARTNSASGADALVVTASVISEESGTARVSASLVAASGEVLGHAVSTIVADEAGTLPVALRFDAFGIFLGASPGPWELRDVVLTDEIDDQSVLAERAAFVHVTAGYDSRLFAPAPIVPVVVAGGPYNAPEGGSIELEARAADPEGEALSYAWDLDDDGVFETSGKTATYAAGNADGPRGAERVRARARDTGGHEAVTEAWVDVTNVAPSIETEPAVTLPPGELVFSTDVAIEDPGPDSFMVVVDYGDGTALVTFDTADRSFGLEHEYTEIGLYTVTVKVTDDDGGEASATIEVELEFEPAGPQVPGDCNKDGGLDISDGICVFGYLFLGNPRTLPCGDGTSSHVANLGLLDWGEDGAINITDGIQVLQFLFLSGPPHPFWAVALEEGGCVAIPGCPANDRCEK